MNSLILKIAKALFFKDASEAWEADKDKPLLAKKRFLAAIGLTIAGIVGSWGYQFDPQAITQLADSINLIVIAGNQIVEICKQSWPIVLAIYSTLLGIIGIFDKNSRDKIVKMLGEPKQGCDYGDKA